MTRRPQTLPDPFAAWFAARGWAARAHQLALLKLAQQGRSALLIAPTGAGKTLAGFLPSLIELASGEGVRGQGLHTLYISPLKALAVDVARNLETPIAEMGLRVRVETRTGDTSASKRQRQRRLRAPPRATSARVGSGTHPRGRVPRRRRRRCAARAPQPRARAGPRALCAS